MTVHRVVSDAWRGDRHLHHWVPMNIRGVIIGWCYCGHINRGRP